MGIENHGVVDLVTKDPTSGEYALIMIETRPWGSAPTQIDDLRAKFNAYLSFVLDGGLVKTYPDSRDQPIRIQLDSFELPPTAVRDVLRGEASNAMKYGIRTVFNVLRGDPTPGELEAP